MQKVTTWGDRFALIDHFKPSDDQIVTAFGITKNQLSAARAMHATGTIRSNPKIDPSKYGEMFGVSPQPSTFTNPVAAIREPSIAYVPRPRSPHQPKRGRSGSKIADALRAVPTKPLPVEDFAAAHGVSVAVLRQSKRFIARMSPSEREQLGTINVKQDKDTKRLMIWRS